MTSSNAYKDRDKQYVAEKALSADVERTKPGQDQGPLRWWHVGQILWDKPGDWTTVKAGPGVDLGRCDFSTMIGRILIESGTFANDALGAQLMRQAPNLQGSLGFAHPPTEPDATGTYWHIKRFERSLTPIGRASNPLTKFIVKETNGMATNEEKLAVLKEYGFSDADIAGIVQSAQTTQKEADRQGITFKEANAAPAAAPANDAVIALKQKVDDMALQIAVFAGNLQALASGEVTNDTITVAATKEMELKARPPQFEGGVASDSAEEVPQEEKDFGQGAPDQGALDQGTADEEAQETGMYVSDLTVAEFEQLMVDSIREAMGPMSKTLDLHGKMDSALQEMKGIVGGYKTKDDTLAVLTSQVDTLTTALKEAQDQLKDLTGSQPRALTAGHRPSADNSNIVQAADPRSVAQKEQTQAQQNPLSWVDSFVKGVGSQNGIEVVGP